MFTNAAPGLLFALDFLCGQTTAARLPGYESHHVLEVQNAGYGDSLFRAQGVKPDEPKSIASGPLLGERLARDAWTATCYPDQAPNKCERLRDDDLGTFWLTPGSSPAPHVVTIELKQEVYVNGIGVFTRQDAEPRDGVITSHEVYLSSTKDGWKSGTLVAYGTWWNDKVPDEGQPVSQSAEKFAIFEPKKTKFIYLKASPDKGGSTSIAELHVYHTTCPSSSPSGLGRWGPTIDFPLVPAGAWVDPKSGNVITFSSANHDRDSGHSGPQRTQLAIWNPNANTVSERVTEFTKHSMFCPGMSLDVHGRIIVTGGATQGRTSIYDYDHDNDNKESVSVKGWIKAQDMKIARGYQSSAICADGRIFVIGGSWNGDSGGKDGEIFNPPDVKSGGLGTWTYLPQCPVEPMETNDARRTKDGGIYRADNHGWLFGWKKNVVFQAGPSRQMNWYTASEPGGNQTAGRRGDDDAMCGVAVMYDASEGKILTAGGSKNYECTPSSTKAYVITLKDSNDSAVHVDSVKDMKHNRIFHNAIILPNGQTFVAGGQSYGWVWTDTNAQLEPEVYDPIKTSWTPMAKHSIVRNYHSIGLLLPDATVFIGGGGLCGNCDEKCKDAPGGDTAPDALKRNNHFNGQIYTPPYLLDNKDELVIKRPQILKLSSNTFKRGQTIFITTDTDITSASLVRYGSTTHGLNTDQRRIPCPGPINTNETRKYACKIPEPEGVAIPGYWMVFVMTAAGVPSVASRVQILVAK